MIRVLFFGPVAESFGTREKLVPYETGIQLQQITVDIQTLHPDVYGLISFIAVNNVQTRDMQLVLNDHDEIAFMSKFSGG